MIKKIKQILYLFLNPKLKSFSKLKVSRINVVNIGSAGDDDFSGMFWNKIKDFSNFFHFDPDNDEIKEKKNLKIFPYGLWDQNDTKEIFITKFPYASSLFEPNDKLLKKFINYDCHEVILKKKILLKKLDNIMTNKDELCDFIKIDAEGSELNILNGSKNNLQNAYGLEVEINFIEKNLGSPDACEVITYLKNKNFDLFILSRESWRKNKKNYIVGAYQLTWADAVFFKNQETIAFDLINLSTAQKQIKILKLLSIFLIYNLYDSAENYLKYFKKEKIISEQDYNNYTKIINKNIENNFLVFLKTFMLLIFSILFLPLSIVTFSKKIIMSNISFIRILIQRFIILIQNLFRYSGPNKVSVSDSIKNL